MPFKVQLKAIHGDMLGKVVECHNGETVVFGRAKECQKGALPREDERASRRHFVISVEAPRVWVQDLGSTHGTIINGKKRGGEATPSAKYPLHEGDTVQAGEQIFVLRVVGLPDNNGGAFPVNAVVPEESRPRLLPDRRPVESMPPASEKVSTPVPSVLPQERPDQHEGGDEKNQAVPDCEQPSVGRGRQKGWLCAGADARAGADAHQLGALKIAAYDGPPVIEGYEILQKLGRGGLGTSFLCRRARDEKAVVIKVVRSENMVDGRVRAVLKEAAATLCTLRHVNIVQVADFGIVPFDSEGTVFCVEMEYCARGSVAAVVEEKGGRVPPHEAYDILLGALAGLAYAHGMGILHGNITPSNILLSATGGKTVAKLGDFALTRVFQGGGLGAAASVSHYLGALPFMPREQVKNLGLLSQGADVWSMGAVFYYLLTGQYPRECSRGEDPYVVALKSTPIPVRERFKVIPKGLGPLLDLIDQSLATSPADRFEGGSQMYQALRRMPRPAVVVVR